MPNLIPSHARPERVYYNQVFNYISAPGPETARSAGPLTGRVPRTRAIPQRRPAAQDPITGG